MDKLIFLLIAVAEIAAGPECRDNPAECVSMPAPVFFVFPLSGTPDSAAPAAPATRTYGPGTYLVGTDIRPGFYRGEADSENTCYWARLSNLTGSNNILANEIFANQTYVEILSDDVAFEIGRDCQFTYMGEEL